MRWLIQITNQISRGCSKEFTQLSLLALILSPSLSVLGTYSIESAAQTSSKRSQSSSKTKPAFKIALKEPLKPRYKKFLKAIAYLESSNGKNVQHKPIYSGIHANTSAIGKYALMPVTIKDLYAKASNPKSDLYPHIHDLKAIKMIKQDPVLLVQTNPEYEELFAKLLVLDIAAKYGTDLNKMAAAWLYGKNCSNIEDKLNSAYVTRFVAQYQLL